LRHQVKIHKIFEKLNKGIKICIFLPPPPFFVENESRKTTKTYYIGKEKKI
jgi:hypothetical protein